MNKKEIALKNNRVVIASLYILLIVCMGIATVSGRPHAIYGSWWFSCLWATLTVLSVIYLIQKGGHRRVAVLSLHLSFVIILLGALTTKLTAEEGSVHLRLHDAVHCFEDKEGMRHDLPFAMRLDEFRVEHYPGTDAIMDYKADITVEKTVEKEAMRVSMNNIGRADGYRFYQSSYDSDLQGTVLLVAYDPYGIALTYLGYIMLFASLIWTLFSKRTKIRGYYRLATRSAAVLLLSLLPFSGAKAQGNITAIDREIADEMGEIAVLYNGRICPLNTAATEFVTKLCGASSWNGHSANEIFVGWMIYYTEWEAQKIIKVKDREVQRLLGIDGRWACVRDFYNADNSYKLNGKVNDTSLPEAVRKAIRETDEKIQVVTMFYNSEMLRVFPLMEGGKLRWYTPGSTELPKDVGEAEFQFINHAMDYLVKYTLAGDVSNAKRIVSKIRLFQREKAGAVIPSGLVMRMEVIYNALHSARWVTFLCLALAFVFCFLLLYGKDSGLFHRLSTVYISLQTLFLTALLGIRWAVSDHAPLSNGYETMLFMAWMTLLLTLLMMRKMPVIKAFGPVISSLCMLVATLATASPQITQLMPVLQSPLLSIHVAMVMMAYSLFAVMTLIAVRALWLSKGDEMGDFDRLTALSHLLLYPAVALLSAGIFIGAVWANVSWGTYWSWDPKETWALITLMVYAIVLHESPITSSRHPRRYHIYVLLAFLSILMTYFGVNFFMSGMHSYA